jgi:hypothetical protein
VDDDDHANGAGDFYFAFPVYLVVDRSVASARPEGGYELTDPAGFFSGEEGGRQTLFVFTDADLARRAAREAGMARAGVVCIEQPARLAGLLQMPAMHRFHTLSFDVAGDGSPNRWAFPTEAMVRRFEQPGGGEA